MGCIFWIGELNVTHIRERLIGGEAGRCGGALFFCLEDPHGIPFGTYNEGPVCFVVSCQSIREEAIQCCSHTVYSSSVCALR